LLRDKKVDDGLLSGAVEELLERGLLLRYGSAYAPAPQGAPPKKLLDVVEEVRGLLRESDPALLLPEAAAELNRSPERVTEAAHYLRAVGEAALLSEVYLWPAATYRKLRRRVLDELEGGGELRVADFKDAVGLSRKFATQFLDHLYEAGMTDRRSGSHRLLDADRGGFEPLDAGLA
jgi:DNA-binding Lrp family transcriptional regulator